MGFIIIVVIFPVTATCKRCTFYLPTELSPRGLAGGLRLHSQNSAGHSLHNHGGGLLTLRSQVKDPRLRAVRTLSSHRGDEAAARS